MSILKDIPELIEADVISLETAEKIKDYYKGKENKSPNKLFIIFGILGAMLVGLGIILIIAHNWDELSRSTKTVIAILPLIIAQALCFFTLLKKQDSVAWIESSTTFLFFAVGSSISLVSQIYNIPGDLSSFLLTWMLLCLPLIYLMRSSMASILYIMGITSYVVEASFFTYPFSDAYAYWILILFIFPHYYRLYKTRPESNFIVLHNWLIPISLTLTLGSVADEKDLLMFMAYMSLFGLFYLVGNSPFFSQRKRLSNGYLIIGSLGTICILLTLSFDWPWVYLRERDLLNNITSSPEFFAILTLSVFASVLLYFQRRNKPIAEMKPIEPVFILFIIIFLIGISSSVAVVLINLLVFAIGLLTIRNGVKQDHLGILNYGLMIIMALVVCKFFDDHLTFVTRGVLFVSTGIGFFVANYLMLKKRKGHE